MGDNSFLYVYCVQPKRRKFGTVVMNARKLRK